MPGLFFVCLQKFLILTYGPDLWEGVVKAAGLDFHDFEPMLSYDPALATSVLHAAGTALDQPCDSLLEDLGTFLVTHKALEVVRRLLRFGGADYISFLESLDVLPDRVRLAMPDLHLPEIRLTEVPEGYDLHCLTTETFWIPVLQGVLRSLADDYGALVFLERCQSAEGHDGLRIHIAEQSFAEGRSFELATNAVDRRRGAG